MVRDEPQKLAYGRATMATQIPPLIHPREIPDAPKVGMVSLGCPKALVDSERILTRLRADGYADQPSYRPLTKFENRGLRLGHGVWDLVFEKA